MENSFLEPCWSTVEVGQHIDVLLTLVIWGGSDPSSRHLCKSAVHQQFIVVTGALSNHPTHSLLGAEVTDVSKGIRLLSEGATVLDHTVDAAANMYSVAEGCAGIGCLGVGLQSAGFQVVVSNDIQSAFCEFQKMRGFENMVCGDVGDKTVIKAMHDASAAPVLLAGGFSCQPWSRLGDHQGCNDPRSKSLQGLLKAGFHLRAHAIILECVCVRLDRT